MLSRTKKLVESNILEEQILVRESCTFTEPVATSSPNLGTNGKKVPFNFAPFYQQLKQLFTDQVIKEEEELKNELIEELNRTAQITKLRVKPEEIFYSIEEDSNAVEDGKKKTYEGGNSMPPTNKMIDKRVTRKPHGNSENDLNLRNKRDKEEELMPPPKKKERTARRTRKDSEKVEAYKIERIRTRSSTRLAAQPGLSTDRAKVVLSEFSVLEKTPMGRRHLRRNRHNIATVTPGPNVDAPQTILRRPNPGETAISLTGSPLLVTSEQISAVPQITIPLTDGRVMSVLAKDGLNPNEFPTMDQQTLSKLKMLHEFLGKL